MTINEKANIYNDKVKQNQAYYDLDKQAAKISALRQT